MIDAATFDFDDFLQRTQSYLRAYIAGMGVARHEVDDLAQDTYVEFYRNLAKVPEGVEPERWIKGIAKNLCLNHFRKSARRGRLHRQAIIEILARTPAATEDLVLQTDAEEALERCVSQIPDRGRRMLILKYEEEYSSAQLAETFEMTSEAIRVSLHRIRAKLRDCLSHRMGTQT